MLTASTPGAPELARTFSHARKTRRFSISNDFRMFGFDLPVGSSPPGGLASSRSDPSGPFTPTPLQGLHRYYGPVCPCAPRRYSPPPGGFPLAFSLSRPGGRHHPFRLAVTIGATGSPVPCQRLRRAHATSTPDTAKTATRQPFGFSEPDQRARLAPGNSAIPRFRCHHSPFRCVN